MTRATISDVILDGTGKPITGATVILLRAADYFSPPTTDPGPGSANYIRQTTSGPGGAFSFSGLAIDDYHVMAKYGGQTVFQYFIPAILADQTDNKASHNRTLVPRTLTKLIRGDNTTIHFVGDSITVGFNSSGTVGGGLVQRMGVLIGQQLCPNAKVDRYDPNAYDALEDGPINGWNGPTTIQSPTGSEQVIQVVNNGVSGDTIQRVLRRIGNLTGWTPVVDLFVIYLGINDALTNDGFKFVPPDIYASGIRSLVEILRVYYPQAELALCTPHANDQPDAGFGAIAPGTYTLDMYADAVRRCCLETGTALVDLRQLWKDARDPSDETLAGSDYYPASWLSNIGGNHTHPLDQGHQVIAEEMFKALFGPPGLSAHRDMRISTLGPQRHFKELEIMRVDNANPAIVTGGGHWNEYAPDLMGELYLSAHLLRSNTTGDTLTFTHGFQDLAILTRFGRDCGIVTVTIDGGTPIEYDLYRAYPANISDTDEDGSVYPMDRLVVATDLAEGTHTAVITVSGGHSPASSNSWFYLDGVELTHWQYKARLLRSDVELARSCFGSFTCEITADRFGTVALDFPRPFVSGNTPCVVASTNQVDHYCTVDSVTNAGCNIRVVNRDGTNETTTVTGQWFVCG